MSVCEETAMEVKDNRMLAWSDILRNQDGSLNALRANRFEPLRISAKDLLVACGTHVSSKTVKCSNMDSSGHWSAILAAVEDC
jgi:hypothetical protein